LKKYESFHRMFGVKNLIHHLCVKSDAANHKFISLIATCKEHKMNKLKFNKFIIKLFLELIIIMIMIYQTYCFLNLMSLLLPDEHLTMNGYILLISLLFNPLIFYGCIFILNCVEKR